MLSEAEFLMQAIVQVHEFTADEFARRESGAH
jgi:hypothetical protein